MPVRGERALFERIVLESFQGGLSWLTILTKRPAFRRAFAEFDPDAVAAFSDGDLANLLADKGIVRNKAKIAAARTNAAATIAVRAHGGLDALIQSHRPADTPRPHVVGDVPTSTGESAELAAHLRSYGFRFIGPTTAYALMEATGMVDTHLLGCHRRDTSGVVWITGH